jgi:predicted nucleic acid-binding protein
VKYFFDTSVLVSVALMAHPDHGPSLDAYVKANPRNGCCAAHSLAEVYATLTRLPGSQRMTADEALLFVEDIQSRLTVVALEAQQFYAAVASAAHANIVGGTIYDMLLAQCALQAKAEIIYTWDVADFSRLGSVIAKRVHTP